MKFRNVNVTRNYRMTLGMRTRVTNTVASIPVVSGDVNCTLMMPSNFNVLGREFYDYSELTEIGIINLNLGIPAKSRGSFPILGMTS